MIAKFEESVRLDLATIQALELTELHQTGNTLDVLRLDKIHPLISGNKWFKLKHALQEALSTNKKGLVTVGGAYSNHILAVASACKEAGLSSVGIIRGEQPKELSCTLKAAKDQGMEIEFMARSAFANKDQLYESVSSKYDQSFLVEEGGNNENGIRGAEEILRLVQSEKYKYICCSIGTGAMMAGVIRASMPNQQVIGISSLKINKEENELTRFLEVKTSARKNYEIIYDYHFGGYAKVSRELLHFMNDFFIQTSIPSDFVYTGKLFYGITDLIRKSYFAPGSAILVIHSGGLQGNCSLKAGTLLF
jgi:1-aminocyclopropane-1-carboxylate deaminase